MKKDLSLIIPVLNEASRIRVAINRLLSQPFSGEFEIIVVDGDGSGSTVKRVEHHPKVTCLISRPGRAIQMNAGAKAASGSSICFLHCDTVLPDHALNTIKKNRG